MMRSRSLVLCFALGAVSALALASNSARGQEHPTKSIVLITIDTCRADALGCYGNADVFTPTMDRMASVGQQFANLRADIPLTLPAHCSLMTGLSLQRHRIRSNADRKLAGDIPLLAQLLRDKGYDTGAVISGLPLTFGCGLQKGFRIYDDHLDTLSGDGALERCADSTCRAALRLADQLTPPYFLWVHFYDVHAPYEAPMIVSSYDSSPYLNEVQWVDLCLGRLVRQLQSSSPTSLIIAITGDHGEDLWQHGEATHGVYLYDSVLTVPGLIMQSPPLIKGGICDRHVSLQVFSSTVLDALDPRPPAGVAQSRCKPDIQYIETTYPQEKYRWSALSGVVCDPYKFVGGGHAELYHLRSDPGEKRNYLKWLRIINVALPSPAANIGWTGRIHQANQSAPPIDEHVLASLRSLGYAATSTKDDGNGSDPRDMRSVLRLSEDASRAIFAGEFQTAFEVLTAALQRDPSNPVLLNDYGLVCQRVGRFQDAIRAFERCLEHDPENSRYWNNLGISLKAVNRLPAAIQAYSRSVFFDPNFAAGHYNLAVAYLAAGNSHQAKLAFSQSIALDPNFQAARDALILLTSDGTIDEQPEHE